jgi:hypothetical protein
MGSGPLSFKDTDLMRAIKCGVKAGMHVVGYEVNPKTGTIVVHVGKPNEPAPESANPWDAK